MASRTQVVLSREVHESRCIRSLGVLQPRHSFLPSGPRRLSPNKHAFAFPPSLAESGSRKRGAEFKGGSLDDGFGGSGGYLALLWLVDSFNERTCKGKRGGFEIFEGFGGFGGCGDVDRDGLPPLRLNPPLFQHPDLLSNRLQGKLESSCQPEDGPETKLEPETGTVGTIFQDLQAT